MADQKYIEKVYKLKENPFESRTDPTVPMAGRTKEVREWTNAVNRRKGSRSNSINFIVGDYGMGKTLTLHKISEQYRDDPEILPVFMKMLPEDKVTKFGVDFVQRLFRSVSDDLFRRIEPPHIEELRSLFPEQAIVFENASYPGNHEALLFLRGDPMSTSQMRKIGTPIKMDKTHIAKRYLICFLFLIYRLGFHTLLLLVDEVEYVFSQMRGANISLVFNTLRDYYDTPDSEEIRQYRIANMIFFLGISSTGWTKLNDLGKRESSEGGPIQPLMRRFEPPIELNPLSAKEVKDLIEKRLVENRVGESVQPLIPYDNTFVDYVFDLSQGNPSEIVKYCDYAMEEGLKQGAKILDEDFARKVFLEYNLIIE